MKVNIRSRSLAGLVLVTGMTGCAINPQTGQPGLSAAAKAQFKSVFDSPDPCSNNARNIGVVAGAVAGGVIGYLAHGTKGAIIGAAAGVGGGLLIGHAIDARRCSLYRIAHANGLRIATAPITQNQLAGKPEPAGGTSNEVGLDVQLQNKDDEFVPGTAELTPQARAYFSQIAAQYAPKNILASLPPSATPPQRAVALSHTVLIVGHTDERDSGSASDPAQLSQERAKAVAKVFAQQGVPTQAIYYQGAGDTLPIANNATAEGRQENQRVQIVDLPTEADLQQYLSQRSANPSNYQFANVTTSAAGHAPLVHGDDGTPSGHGQDASAAPLEASSTSAGQDHSAKPAHKVAGDATRVRHHAVDTDRHDKNSSVAAAHDAAPDYDFGGNPMSGEGLPVALGAPISHSAFSFISTANAASILTVGSCMGDRPHNASAVRNLRTDEVLKIRDYVPGFYGAPWTAGMGGNLIALLNARVPSDAGSPIPEPDLTIYKDYKGDAKQRPSFSARVPVNVYRGSDATLYRLFVQGPMQCMDLVVPNGTPRATGNVYYSHRSANFIASGAFALR